MGTGYTRNDTTNNIADGNVIDAADLDGEFDAIQSAFNANTGHTHDGTSAEGAPITVTGPAQEYVSTGTEFRPKTNNAYDLGNASLQWKNAYVAGDITVGGTIDGRDVAADGSKLDGIEAGATADQTAAEIRALVEAATDSNVFTDADHTKLNGIEAGATADQTAGEIKTAYESNADTNAFTDAEQSKLSGIEAGADVTDTANVTAAGALMDSELTNITAVKALNQGVATTDSPSFAAATINGNITVTGTVDGRDVAEDGSKLDGIEAGATAYQTITAGSGLTGGGTGNVTLSHADTSSQSSVNNSGGTVIQDVTVDTYGHITALGSTNLDTRYLGISSKAADAELLDGLNSTQFLRSDATDTMSGRLNMGNVLDMNNFDIEGASAIIHHEDTNTYMQFHASDQWRVVTGGVERIEVTSSAITMSEPLTVSGTVTATSFSGDGSGLTGIQAGAGYFQGENGNTGDTTNGKGDIFRTHESTLNTNVTIASGDNSLAAGPLTVASGVTLTVSGNLSIV